MKNSFQEKSYAKVNSGSVYSGLFSFILLSFLLLLFPSDVFSGQVTLTWNAPTTNADGTPISYFSGDYRIYYGTASGSYSQVRNLKNSSSIVTQQVPDLTNGQPYFFVVTAVNTLDNESAYSNQVSKTALAGTPTSYTITASQGANGTVSPAGTRLVNSGAGQAYAITPGSGYYVASVLVDGASVGPVTSYTFSNITANHTISATFTDTVSTPIFPGTSGLYWDDVNKRLGVGTAKPNQLVHAKKDQDGVTALRVENQNIFGISSPLAQEQFALGPAGNEHLMLQVLSGTHPTLPSVALMNAYTHDLFFRTNAVNVLKTYREGAIEDTLVLDNGAVGIGVNMPNQRLEVNGGMRLIPNAAVEPKPACNAISRGTFWFTQDNTNGDSAEVCARVGGAYAWRRLF